MELAEKEMLAREKLCLPLDGLNTMEEVWDLIEELRPVVGMFKIGKETFTRFGPMLVRMIRDAEAEVFLDLKFHDIPNTVKGAAIAATELGVYMFNVHTCGGKEMMEAAMEGVDEAVKENGVRTPKVIGVTMLTSIDKRTMNEDLRIEGEVADEVLHLAKLAESAGLDGIVCSGADLDAIKDKLPKDFMFVTPGIKMPDSKAGADQKRVMTPGNAIAAGSSILVVGRAITGHKTKEDRLNAAHAILKDMALRLA